MSFTIVDVATYEVLFTGFITNNDFTDDIIKTLFKPSVFGNKQFEIRFRFE
ncbi:MAG: hypothetical protein J6S67_08180 [Methanobrevibacter sp.]|nr:hypothetical protein [Methanobrevibacter sp.]